MRSTRAIERTTRATARRPMKRLGRLMTVAGLAVGAAALAATAAAALTLDAKVKVGPVQANVQVSVPLPADPVGALLSPIGGLPVVNQLSYQVHTRVNNGSGCTAATDRVVTSVFGVPTPVDVGGNLLPDVLVTVVPVPAIPGVTNTTTLNLQVKKLALGNLPALVEVVLAPNGTTDPSRVAFGYDACDSTVPGDFSTKVIQSPTQLSIDAQPSNPGNDLTVIGSQFTQVGTARVNPTAVAARFEPVPSQLTTVVDILGGGRYDAHVTSAIPSKVNLHYLQQTATSSTTADVLLDKLPQATDVVFGGTEARYTASAPIHTATAHVVATATGQRTLLVDAALTDMPVSASFVKDGPTHGTFSAPGGIGVTALRFASFDPGNALPAVQTNANQFLAAQLTDHVDLVDFRLLGLSTVAAGWGDPLSVDLTHTAGPFDISVVTPDAHVTGAVRDLPDQVHLSFERTTQAAAYSGSATIASMSFDVTAAQPLAVRANQAHLLATGVPTGLTTVMDKTAQTFTANLTGGKLGMIQLQLTSGPNEQLSGTGDGLFFDNPAADDATAPPGTPFVVFARVSGIQSATIGWGDPLKAQLVHDPSPFDIDVHTADKTVAGHLDQLPGTVDLSYSPGHTLSYQGSDVIHTLTLDLTSTTPFTANANVLHAHITDVPRGLTFTQEADGKSITADTTNGSLGVLEVQLTSGPDDRLADGVNGVLLESRLAPDSYVAFARLAGLSHAHVGWDDPITADVTSAGGPLHITFVKDQTAGEFSEVIQTRAAEVDVADFPATASFRYSPSTQDIHYTGSSTIDRVEADMHQTCRSLVNGDCGFPIAGTATHMHLLVRGVPTELDRLTIDLDHADNQQISFSVPDTQSVGLVELTITDDSTTEQLPAGTDGLLLFNGGDTDPTATHVPYYIFARATGLQNLHYGVVTTHNANVANGDLIETQVHVARTVRNDLHVEMRTPNLNKVDDIAFLKFDFSHPPQSIDVVIDDNKIANGGDFFRTITYQGNAPTNDLPPSIEMQTNQGDKRTLLDVVMAPMPNVVQACLSSSFGDCDTPEYDIGGNLNEQSYNFVVSQPTELTVTDCTENAPDGCVNAAHSITNYSGSLTSLDLHIDLRFLLHAEEHEVTGTNNSIVHIDTLGQKMTGDIRKDTLGNVFFSGSYFPTESNDLHLGFPDGPDRPEGLGGFRASNRYVEIGCSIVTFHCSGDSVGGHPMGHVACPPGTTISQDVIFGHHLHFQDEFCPAPQPSSMSPSSATLNSTQAVDMFGDSFSPGATLVFFKDGIPTGHVFADNGNLAWFAYDHIKATITVDGDAAKGTYDVLVTNPEDAGDNFCGGCFTVN